MKAPQWPQRHAEALTSSLQTPYSEEDTGRSRRSQESASAIFVPNSDAPSPMHEASPAESKSSLDYASSSIHESPQKSTPMTNLDPRRDSHNDHLSDLRGTEERKTYLASSQATALGFESDISSPDLTFIGSSEHQSDVGLAALLTKFWYTDACHKLSTFDPFINRHSQLAMILCPRSEAVACAMQCMSAACLVETLPQARDIQSSLTSRALCAIRQDLAGFLSARTLVHMGVPVESLFATFALGTAMLWSNSRELAFSLRDKVAKMLDLCDVDQEPSNSQERRDFEYFQACLIHWDFLSFRPSLRLENKLASLRGDFRKIPAGISGTVQEKYTLVLCLCQQERVQQQQQWFGSWSPSSNENGVVSNETITRDFRDELAGLVFDDANALKHEDFSKAWTKNDAKHNSVPGVSEAFRLAALLQLYLTFSGLDVPLDMFENRQHSITRLRQVSSPGIANSRRRETFQIALRLVELMKRLHSNSGTACIQLLLCFSAATGLRHESTMVGGDYLADGESSMPKSRQDSGVVSYEQLFESFSESSLTSGRTSPIDLGKDRSQIISSHAWNIAQARREVVKSLEGLRVHLPPRVGEVTLHTIKAIWATYDSDDQGYGQEVHWLDVVGALGLQTLFG